MVPPILEHCDNIARKIMNEVNSVEDALADLAAVVAQGVAPATLTSLGIVKPDGSTIGVDGNGTISLSVQSGDEVNY